MTTHRIGRPDPPAQRVLTPMPQNPGGPFGRRCLALARRGRWAPHVLAVCMPSNCGGQRPRVSTIDSQSGTRIGFDLKARTVAESCNAATQPEPACRSSDAAVLTAPTTAGEPQQPGYLSHSDAAAAPVDRFAYRQILTLVIVRRACPARCSASRTRASRSASAVSAATARASSRRSRSARSFRSTAWASNAERRAACLTDC